MTVTKSKNRLSETKSCSFCLVSFFKDTLKAFDDFKKQAKKCMK